MSQNRSNKISNKKKISAILAVMLILALLTGGTYAWTEFRQSITNRFRGGGDNDVLLHDDFEPEVNKDVYVENTGENPLIVRVMFKEYFQIGNESIIGGNASDKKSWMTHLFPQESEPEDCGLASHDYFEWVLSGEQKAFKPGTGEIGNQPIALGDTFPDGTTAKNTLGTNPPITMAEYKKNQGTYDAEADGRWILDEDGWAYWSKLLPKGEATNLLLDNVVVINRPDDNYYYAIDVILQASNRTEAKDIIKSKEGITQNGKDLVESLAGQTVTETETETESESETENDETLSFLEPYDENPTYIPAENLNSRIRFVEKSYKVYAFSSTVGANLEVGLPLDEIVEDTEGIKIAKVQIPSRGVELNTPEDIAEYKVSITQEGKLAVSFLPTYDEIVAANPEVYTTIYPDLQVPVIITLSNAEGTKTGTFTIYAMFIGSISY